jgi:hypothetical protein
MKRNKLGNPAAVAAASNPELIKAGKDVVINVQKQTMDTIKLVAVVGGTIITGWFLNKKYKEWRKQIFIQENAHIPDVQAAMIFRKAMFKTEPLDFLLGIITIPDGTDEATLNKLATQISSLENVVYAYKVLFEGNMILDVYDELNNKELQKFFDRLNSKSEYDTGFTPTGQIAPQKPYRVGEEIKIKNPKGATIWEAEELNNGTWKNSGQSLDFKKYDETIGTIMKVYKSTSSPQHFYVVDRKWVVDSIFGYGWVAHTDVKPKD